MRAINETRDAVVADAVRAARSLWARSRGLLGRKGMEAGEGLLIEPCSAIHSFGMAFVFDAIFLNREGVVVHLVPEMRPLRMSRYVFKARSVLELPAGTIRRTRTQVGDRLVFKD